MKGMGIRVQMLRNAQNWSQKTLGKRAGGINVETVNRIEHDHNTGIDKLHRIAKALGVPFAELLPDEERVSATHAPPDDAFICSHEHRTLHQLLENILVSEPDAAEWIRGNLVMFNRGLQNPPSGGGIPERKHDRFGPPGIGRDVSDDASSDQKIEKRRRKK